jgi:amicyanin
MKKIVIILIVLVVVVGGGAGVFLVMKKSDDKKNNTANSSGLSNDSSMNGMNNKDMTGSEKPSGSSSSGASQDNGAASGDTSNAESTDQVKIANFAFTPASIKIKVGTKVTWTNTDSVKHNIAMDNGTDGPSSPMLGKGDTYSYTFTKAGTFSYHCTPHPYMKGTVVVSE